MNTRIHVLMVGFVLLFGEAQTEEDISNLDEKVQNYIKQVSDKYLDAQDTGCQTKQCLEIFSTLEDVITKALDSGVTKGHINDNKAVQSVDQLKKQLSKLSRLKDAKNTRSTSREDAAKKGLNTIKRGLSNFFESLKPLKAKASKIAIDVHNAIRRATDKILEKLPRI